MSTRDWSVSAAPVDDEDAAALLRCYLSDLVSRYLRRPASSDEIDAAAAENPSDDLAGFLVARCEGSPAGCVGLRRLGPDVAEVKRLFVRPALRNLGGGCRLLTEVEGVARRLGARAMRLDTRHDLLEARNLYAKHAYVEIPPYSEGPYAEHWFEKRLS